MAGKKRKYDPPDMGRRKERKRKNVMRSLGLLARRPQPASVHGRRRFTDEAEKKEVLATWEARVPAISNKTTAPKKKRK